MKTLLFVILATSSALMAAGAENPTLQNTTVSATKLTTAKNQATHRRFSFKYGFLNPNEVKMPTALTTLHAPAASATTYCVLGCQNTK
jgi:hypothetical protein